MPSQITLRTSPVLSNNSSNRIQVGHKAVILKNSAGGDGADMKAAARTAGSFLVAHKSIRKPHNMVSVNLNGCCGKTDNSDTPPKCFSSGGLPNGNGTVNMNLGAKYQHMNGIDTPPLTAGLCNSHGQHNKHRSNSVIMEGQCNSLLKPEGQQQQQQQQPSKLLIAEGQCGDSFKTKGQHSNNQSSLTDVSNKGRLMCPELAISYTGKLVRKRARCLATKQRDLEQRVASLQKKIRLRQLHMVHSHACRQLNFEGSMDEQDSSNMDEGSCSSLTDSDFSMNISSPQPGGRRGLEDLPIQVDGASDDAFPPEAAMLEDEGSDGGGPERKRTEDSFSSLDSHLSSVCLSEVEDSGGADALLTQLASLETLLDGDMTEASSDEEVEGSVDLHYKHDLRCFWDHARSAVGSRWAWLQRRVAELNKQIYRLDHHMKESCSQDKCVFGPAPPTTAASAATATLPQYMSLTNGSVLEHLRASNAGGGLIATAGLKPTNGFSHHPHTTGHAQCLPHLLLPEGLLSGKLQVKDLLSPSPVDRNLLFVNSSAARTRPLVRRANTRIVRKKGMRAGRSNLQPTDVAFHPHLSMTHELPSRIPLDSALRNILSEHSYAQLPPLSKRRKAASSLAHLSTPLSHDYERNRSASPSPVHTPQSLDSSRDYSARKKQLAPLLQYQTSVDSSGGSPWSPGISRPSTPSFTPLQSARKKRVTNSTPLFDIDNIVIPYSMASSTRLEKLEYKEILTPSWREAEVQRTPSQGEGDVEDCSDEAFSIRHGRCELMEKKRFLNFISGAQRKRGRPQSMTLLDSPALTSPPPPRRLTIASPSPTYAETELATRIRTVVLPWPPRGFPLDEAEQEALVTPPPPPIITRPTSPPHFCTSTPSKTPSCTSLATPVGSPHSACYEDNPANRDTPAISPVEWIINSQFPHAASTLYNHSTAELMPSPPVSQNPIILKLTKKV